MLKKMLVPALVLGSSVPLFAQTASALETGAGDAIEGLATTAGTLLLAALGLLVAFAVFKIVKRAIAKI